MTSHPMVNFTVNAMASYAGAQSKNCIKNWCLRFLVSRLGFAAYPFTKAILCLAGLVLSGLLGVTAPALAQTAPYLDANGWTAFTPVPGTGSCSNGSYTGTCIIYVSSSTGSDSNNGQTVSTPVQTLDKGLSLLRNGHPDWLLLKRGDIFLPDAIGNSFGVFSNSGASATEPMVIGSYDPSQPGVVDPYVAGARPLIETSSTGGTADSAFMTMNGTGGDFIAIVGIEFYNYTADPSNANYNPNWNSVYGIYLLNPVTWWLVEDCKFSFYIQNISINIYFSSAGVAGAATENPASLFTMNRNAVVDAYSTNSSQFSEGLYINGIPNLSFTQNLFDHNGWNATVAGAGASEFNRNIYIQANLPSLSGTSNPTLSYTNNISTQSSAEGAHFRFGGTVTNNLWAYNAIGFDIGCTTTDNPVCVPISSANVTNNVIQSSTDISPSSPRGTGFTIVNSTGSGIQFTNNVIADVASTSPYATALVIEFTSSGVVANNNIIYNWPNAIDNEGTGDTITPNAINLTGYPNAGVTIATYDSAGLGGPGTFADFIAKARLQSKANGWNTALTASAVNAYIQAGFGITSSSSTTSSSSSSTTSTSSSSTSSSSTSSSSTSSSSTTSTSSSSANTSAGLVAAVLPESRSAQVGSTVTAFATIINAGTTAGSGCSISPATSLPVTFVYQTTNPTTNALTGTANTSVSIAGNNGSQSFVIALTPSAAFAPTNVALNFSCSNVAPAPVVTGLNTLLLSASTTPTPDVVALAATMQNDGIVHVTGTPSEGEFAVATDNLGSGGTITVATNTGAATLPVTITLCQTNPQSGQCLQTPSATVALTINSNATPTFGVFVSASGAVALNPANNRIFVTFTDSTKAVRGETSVAVETQ